MGRRNIEKHIRFSKEEYAVICRRSEKLKMRAGTYIRTISVQGSIKVFSLKELNDVYRAINKIGVNLNQIAAVVNSTGAVYQKDIEDIQNEFKQMRIIIDNWLEPLEAEVLL